MALETKVFNARHEHFSTGDACVENAFELQAHTPTASYQPLLSRIYVKMIAIVTASYF